MSAAPRITAVLGPTNTGKTYLAIERMLGHASGTIGFPLRLLARENYDRCVRLRGADQVALVTGEEKIIPPTARYFCCTVESMPLDRPVDFLAVDEIQLCADRDRGHIFTDRLLRARGLDETMFLGAETIAPLIRRLVPDAEIISRPRFSKLSYVGPRKITRLPPRTAVIAFSADAVYQAAELIRSQRGGAAVVLGALSPRTRNAQVALYQAGDVDYVVATDAIGMGLNMDIDHVVFTSLSKFDGHRMRRLTAPEVAQIAGRAGRHMNNGTFGPTAELGAFEPELIEAVEEHRFDPLTSLSWRNAALRFDSLRGLLASLDEKPPAPELMRKRDAEDQAVLVQLARDPEIERLATNPGAVRLLWDVCQIPDFRQSLTESHLRLVGCIYRHLRSDEGRLPADWVADQMARIDRTDGDIDTLTTRIAHIRTWTYVSHTSAWLDDAAHWQERARAIEDRLSDALHERLTQRFVDRRAAALTRLRGQERLSAAVSADGEVTVEGEFVGMLEGFRFTPDSTALATDRRALLAAANRVLAREVAGRVERLVVAPDDDFSLAPDGTLSWAGAPVARLVSGATVLSPAIDVRPCDHLTADMCETVRRRLARWLNGHLTATLGPLKALADADLNGAARGLAFQLGEALGSLPRRAAIAQTRALSGDDRKALRQLGIRLGFETVYLPALIKPAAARLRATLWGVACGRPAPEPPPPGLVTVAPAHGVPHAFYEAVGFRVVGSRAVRVDMLDRIAITLRRRCRKGPATIDAELMSLAGLGAEALQPIVEGLGYRAVEIDGGTGFMPGRRPAGDRPRKARRDRRKAGTAGKATGANGQPDGVRRPPGRDTVDDSSPFAKLRELQIRE